MRRNGRRDGRPSRAGRPDHSVTASGQGGTRLELLEAHAAEMEARDHAEHDRRWADHERQLAEQRARRRARRARLAAATAAAAAAVVIGALLIELRGTSRAAAAPDQAAAAAQRAGTFAFLSTSELLAGTRLVRASRTTGEVNLRRHAFRSTVTEAGAVSGFERIVFPTAIYTRATAGRASRFWVGSRISPPVSISVSAGTVDGFSDPLGLLAVLSRLHHATPIGTAREHGFLIWGYTVTTTFGALAAIEGRRVSSPLASTPVTIDVWQDVDNHLIRAVRTFALPAGERLRVSTRFSRYGRPTSIVRPSRRTVGEQPLDPFAADPIGASVLTALAVGVGHTSAPTDSHR